MCTSTLLTCGNSNCGLTEGFVCASQVLRINPDKRDIESFTFDDFTLEGYNPHRKIAMEMAV